MKIGAGTHQGRVRKSNEDSFGYHDHLFVVADGMGGHSGGEIASSLAVETILAANLGPELEKDLDEAIQTANQVILAETVAQPELKGMGTTVALLYLDDNLAHVINVGDSRIYIYSGQDFRQLTEDHSLVAELVKKGNITREEALVHPQRNIVTQALGTDGKLEITKVTVPYTPGDRFLLCSDGLTGMLTEAEIMAQLIRTDELQMIVDDLITLANENGGHDNITVILVEA